jgi:nitrate reductase NapE component
MSISSRKRGMSLIIIERGIPMPLPSLDKGDVPVYGICLYMFQLIY